MKDLFETPELIPAEVQAVLEKWEHNDASYETCQQLVEDLEKVGYTCSYGLDAVPYFLRKMFRVPDVNQDLIEAVVEQIKEDIEMGDVESLEELLRFVPKENLIQYLPEEIWDEYMD